jgi:predicted nucleotidyltransferase
MEANIEVKRRELGHICAHRNVSRLALFGSAASGEFDAGKSDLDFAVEFAPMPPTEHKRAYFGLLSQRCS